VPTTRFDDDATIGPVPARPPAPGGFTPGAIVAGRYRLVALLGRGGMGEVYRADDLTLDQPVALKFLPGNVTENDSRLAQFHNELRVARQVSHKNVVRLYDLGAADGRRFLTMEYVDGEDLGSLLRRIGRIPQDKAIDLARQLCAGVAAAHERGVLHRDLKPANVMIDGDGNVRITDFGIATAGGDGDATTAGTPQYMAPEQLAGKPASIRTDIYSLGLILFEIFTGRRAYDAKSVADLKQLHDTGTVTTPSSIVRDLDPAVERVILRCLERDPEQRPPSALTVAVALPGGDPLAAALAAGETPSPELLVAAGEREATPVAVALGLAAAFAIGLAAFVAMAPRTNLPGFDALEKPPAVLADRAEQIFASLGYKPEEEADHADGFSIAQDYPRWIEQNRQTPDRWEELRAGRPAALVYWYRTSPRDLIPLHAGSPVSSTDPPEVITNMRTAILDTRGRLQEFHAVPPQVDSQAPAAIAPAWKALFDAAGLDMASFEPVEPEWTPHNFADTRMAWRGRYAERPEPIRVEAAAYRGRPTYFFIAGPWARPARMAPLPRTALQAVLSSANFVVYFSVLAAAAFVARRNVRTGRADSRSAFRLAACLVVAMCASWMVQNHHTATVGVEADQFFATFGNALYLAGTLWVLYLAAEPYARRLWPDGLLGWTRFFAGHIRDPRVGRDILIGCVFGALTALIEAARIVVPPLFGQPMPRPQSTYTNLLQGPHYLVGVLGNLLYGSLQIALFCALMFVGLRYLLKRNWAAFAVLLVVLLAIADNGQAITGGIGSNTLFYALMFATPIVALVGYGLLAATISAIVGAALTDPPFPAHLGSWAGASAIWTLALLLGLAAFGFYSSRAGQPLFGKFSDEA
jgi:hypothetical protein